MGGQSVGRLCALRLRTMCWHDWTRGHDQAHPATDGDSEDSSNSDQAEAPPGALAAPTSTHTERANELAHAPCSSIVGAPPCPRMGHSATAMAVHGSGHGSGHGSASHSEHGNGGGRSKPSRYSSNSELIQMVIVGGGVGGGPKACEDLFDCHVLSMQMPAVTSTGELSLQQWRWSGRFASMNFHPTLHSGTHVVQYGDVHWPALALVASLWWGRTCRR